MRLVQGKYKNVLFQISEFKHYSICAKESIQQKNSLLCISIHIVWEQQIGLISILLRHKPSQIAIWSIKCKYPFCLPFFTLMVCNSVLSLWLFLSLSLTLFFFLCLLTQCCFNLFKPTLFCPQFFFVISHCIAFLPSFSVSVFLSSSLSLSFLSLPLLSMCFWLSTEVSQPLGLRS